MRATTHPAELAKWQVIAVWYGTERVIFEGTLPGCLEFIAQNDC